MLRHSFALSLVIGIAVSVCAVADVYKTVDKQGRVTYTDVAPANVSARPIELKPVNSLPAPEVIPYASPVQQTAEKDMVGYQIQMLTPENGTTLMPGERSVKISVGLNQDLNEGDLLEYRMDNTLLVATRDMEYTLIEPPRGEHSISVDVVDAAGNSLAQSAPVTLVVMRPFVKQKPVPVPKK